MLSKPKQKLFANSSPKVVQKKDKRNSFFLLLVKTRKKLYFKFDF